MSKPKILELEEIIKKMQTNMALYENKEISYSHTGDNRYLKEPIRFSQSRGNGAGLTFKNNAIEIGAGIKHINIKGIANLKHSESDGRIGFLYIFLNGAQICGNCTEMKNMNPYIITTYKDYVEVKEGDLVQLYVAIDNANFKTVGNTETQLTVQVVD